MPIADAASGVVDRALEVGAEAAGAGSEDGLSRRRSGAQWFWC